MRIDCVTCSSAVIVALVACAAPERAAAQSTIGYITAGPAIVTGLGNRDSAFHFGGGGEVLTGQLGIGGTIGYIFFPEVNKTFAGGWGGSSSPAVGFVMLGFNGTYYFAPDADR